MVSIQNPDFDLWHIAHSGQCFRLNPSGEGRFWLVAGGRFLFASQTPGGPARLECSQAEFEDYWREYFDLNTDYACYRAAIPKEDAFLTRAAEFGRGIRILRQDPFETLITFILSQRKNIPAIKAGVEKLCHCFGPVVGQGPCGPLHAFPGPAALAAQSEETLRGCALGYRAPYVRAAARLVAEEAVNLEKLETAPDEELEAALLSVPGVGVKVARCVALFAFHRIAAFPVDVWIERVIREEYAGHFPLERYPGFAGVMQQYMFYYARNHKGN